jgi:hypothetical protein
MTVRAVRPVPCSIRQSAKPSVGPVEFVYRYTITRSIVSACVPDDCMAAADHLGDGPVLDQPRADHDRVRRYRTNRTASTAPRDSGIGVMFSDTVASGAARPTPAPIGCPNRAQAARYRARDSDIALARWVRQERILSVSRISFGLFFGRGCSTGRAGCRSVEVGVREWLRRRTGREDVRPVMLAASRSLLPFRAFDSQWLTRLASATSWR